MIDKKLFAKIQLMLKWFDEDNPNCKTSVSLYSICSAWYNVNLQFYAKESVILPKEIIKYKPKITFSRMFWFHWDSKAERIELLKKVENDLITKANKVCRKY